MQHLQRSPKTTKFLQLETEESTVSNLEAKHHASPALPIKWPQFAVASVSTTLADHASPVQGAPDPPTATEITQSRLLGTGRTKELHFSSGERAWV